MSGDKQHTTWNAAYKVLQRNGNKKKAKSKKQNNEKIEKFDWQERMRDRQKKTPIETRNFIQEQVKIETARINTHRK